MFQDSYNTLDRKRTALLKKMSKAGPFIMATASKYKAKCGNIKCKCQIDKKHGHETMHLSWTDSKGDGTCYVPVDLREEVLAWVENYWTVKENMTQMTALSRRMIRMYAGTLGKVRRRQKKKEILREKRKE